MSTFIMASLSVNFVPFSEVLPNAYDVSEWTLFYINMVYNIMYLPGNFIANYIFDSFGMRIGMQTGISLSIIGTIFRVMIDKSFNYAVLG